MHTSRIQRRVPIRAKKLKKRMGGQLLETGEEQTNGGHQNE
jgi:hypothetical protein